MNNRITACFSCNADEGKLYEVVSGSSFSDSFNEELDSATIIISHVSEEDRLLKINAYDFCNVFSDDGEFNHTYLVDNFDEREDRINDKRLFTYTISLMSETKLLEKIQCPSLTITHTVENGVSYKKTIFEKICEYMYLYVPKIKKLYSKNGKDYWRYEHLIEIPGNQNEDGTWTVKDGYEEFYEKFSVATADLGSSCFTLRQLLTMLMQQVSCIPTVVDLKLGFLDFNKQEEEMDSNDYTINKVSKSLSSDSFANTLVNMSSNVLDSGNTVVSETLGFRDKNNVLLKQQENLYLETKFPIYKIEECKMNCLLKNGTNQYYYEKINNLSGGPASNYIIFKVLGEKITSGSDRGVKAKIVCYSGEKGWDCGGTLTITITTFSQNGQNIEKKEEESFRLENFALETEGVVDVENKAKSSLTTTSIFEQDFDFFIIQATGTLYAELPSRYEKENSFLSYISNSSPLTKPMMISIDITPLVKESQERNLLETNFTEVDDCATIEDLSKYIYGTLGYTIGDKKITGFSSYYSQLKEKKFVYQYGQTYIEGIYNWLKNNYFAKEIRKKIKEKTGIDLLSDKMINLELFDGGEDFVKFTQFTFDIKYQPLNSFNLSYVKQDVDVDFPIEQYNSQDSGLVDFDRLSINQQETVDRIGNPTLAISQRIKFGDFSNKIYSLPAIFIRDGEKHIVFKRTYTINNYHFDVSYIASKNAILKNYFTSIRTKYRAYEYVDYNQSTLRKEKDIIFVRIGEDYFDGDDKMLFPNGRGIENFASAILSKYGSPLKYACETSKNSNSEDETIKNDISLVSNKNGFAIIYEHNDNISSGPYVGSTSYRTYYSDYADKDYKDEDGNDVRLGGVPQKWQLWKTSDYNYAHEVKFVSELNYYRKNDNILFFENFSDAKWAMEVAAKSPIVPRDAQNVTVRANIVGVCDNKVKRKERTFYKDLSERINHTIQFIYYSTTPRVKWTENFILGNGFIEAANYDKILYFGTESPELNMEYHDIPYSEGDVLASGGSVQLNGNKITVNFGSSQYLKVCYAKEYTDENGDKQIKVSDVIIFKRVRQMKNTDYFYITLNDTKTDYFMRYDDTYKMLIRTGTVNKNSLIREVGA